MLVRVYDPFSLDCSARCVVAQDLVKTPQSWSAHAFALGIITVLTNSESMAHVLYCIVLY